ncbi:MAG TPA: hypothetical protein VFE86_09135 [Ilumatobacteraceae bacterium]|nr:hypothetical protein [Ilumatobacteraceae bacterium]
MKSDDPTTSTRSRVIRVDVAGTAVFVIALVVAVPYRSHRFAQFLIGGVSMALFAIGVASTLWAYARALERSRVEEVGVANLYLLTGPTAPKAVRRTMTSALATQIVAAVVGAWIGVVGLDTGELNALAFGVLVPMFGIGMNGVWAALHGWYGPRVGRAVSPPEHEID